MNKEQMEDAVAEMRLLIDLLERGVLKQKSPGQVEKNLRLYLQDRELWLQSGILLSSSAVSRWSAKTIGIEAKRQLEAIEDSARMCTKAEAIDYLNDLRSKRGHEPIGRVHREWLDRIFVRERHSKAWIYHAGVMATLSGFGESKGKRSAKILTLRRKPKDGSRRLP